MNGWKSWLGALLPVGLAAVLPPLFAGGSMPAAAHGAATAPVAVTIPVEEHSGSMAQGFSRMDADGDGAVDPDEWPGTSRSFANHDWNGDGVLSGREVAGSRRRLVDDDYGIGRFLALDGDGNGVLTPDEWQGDATAFTHHDRNGDGVIDKQEFRDRRPDPPATERQHERPWHFRLWDDDADQRIELAEWPADAGAFNRLDRDLDGVLEPGEWLR